MLDWLDLVACPGCGGRLAMAEGQLACHACGRTYDQIDGIPRLLLPDARDTMLDIQAYTTRTAPNAAALERVFSRCRDALTAIGKTLHGNLLEIGTGSGLMTEALIRFAALDSIVTTDVSMKFLRQTKERLSPLSPNLAFLACDGNNPPFRAGLFDVVIGRSVLHHLLHYQRVLRRLVEILRPRGIAAFSEPVQSGMVLLAFMFNVILELEGEHKLLGLMRDETRRVRAFARATMRASLRTATPEELERIEDKYVFDSAALCAEAREAGFSEAHFVNLPPIDTTFALYFKNTLTSLDIRPELAEKMSWLTRAFGETIGAAAGSRLTGPTGYFVFIK